MEKMATSIPGKRGYLKERAINLHRRGKLKEAVACYEQYLLVNSNDAGIWTNLGAALRSIGHYQSSINCHRRAHALAPEMGGILTNLANALKDAGRLEEAMVISKRAVEQEPDSEGAWFNHAVVLREAKQFVQALAAFEQCERLGGKGNARYEWERALCYLYLGHFSQGWQAYEARWRNGMLTPRSKRVLPWKGEPLRGKRILIHGEQGFGDAILAARYLPVLAERGGEIVLECRKPLHRLFACLPVVALITPEEQRATPHSVDYHCGMMSLPGILWERAKSIPAPAKFVIPESSRKKLGPVIAAAETGLKVGIVWSGSLTFADNRHRSPGLEPFLALAEIPGVKLFSLQKGPCEKDLDRHFARSYIRDLAPFLDDFADTAAAVEALDIVVMGDSSVAHLAGSLGKPVINLLHFKPYWLYMPETESTAWYPSMRLLRQSELGNWDPVFSRAAQMLKDYSASTGFRLSGN